MVKGGTKAGGDGVDKLSNETPWLFRILTMISNSSIKYLTKRGKNAWEEPLWFSYRVIMISLVNLGVYGGVLYGVDVTQGAEHPAPKDHSHIWKPTFDTSAAHHRPEEAENKFIYATTWSFL